MHVKRGQGKTLRELQTCIYSPVLWFYHYETFVHAIMWPSDE